MKKLLSLQKWLLLMSFALCFTSCEKDESNNSTEKTYTVDAYIESNSSILFGTSWRYQQTNQYDENGNYRLTSGKDYDFTYTFTNELHGDNLYKLLVNGQDHGCSWCIDNNGLQYYALHYGYANGMSAREVGGWNVCGGLMHDGEIRTLTSSELIVREYNFSSISNPGEFLGYDDHIFSKSNNNHYVGGGDDEEDDDRGVCQKCFGDGICAVCGGDGLCFDIIADYYTCPSCGGDGICARCDGTGKR